MNLFRWLFMLLAFPAFALASDCDSVGPSRSRTPEYFISCIYLADSATAPGNRSICTAQILENVDEWYFFISEDDGATGVIAISILNYFEEDDDPTTICQLTENNPECRWIRTTMGNLHKSLQAVIVTAPGITDLDIQVCMTRYIHQ